MKHPLNYAISPKRLLSLLIFLLSGLVAAAVPLGVSFTYQGRLADSRGPATGRYDFQFSLYDEGTNGSLISGPLIIPFVDVANGLFTVGLDFGNVFASNARWLQISARTNGSASFSALLPRQQLTPVPAAAYASSSGMAMLASGVSTNAITSAMLADGAVTSLKISTGAVKSIHIDDGGSGTYDELMGMASGLRHYEPLLFDNLSAAAGERPVLTFRLDGTSFGTVVAFSGRESLSEVYEYVVEVLSPPVAKDPAAQIGRQGGLFYERSGRITTFAGVITGCTRAAYRTDGMLYTFRLEPTLSRLGFTSNYRVYQDATLPDIVSALYAEDASNTLTAALTVTYPKRDLTIQFGETDLNFFNRLLEHFGTFYYFRQGENMPTLVLGDSFASYTAAPYTSVSYYGNYPTNPQPNEECLRTFQRVSREAIGSAALLGYDFTAPQKNLLAETTLSADSGESLEFTASVTQTAELEALARVRAESQQVEHHLALGGGNVPDLRPGYTFNLDDRSGSGASGSYVVTSVRHSAFRRTVNGVANIYYGNEVQVLPALTPFRPARKTPCPVAPASTAVVVGKAGEEVWTDKYGRVKVQFHWDRRGSFDDKSSGWVRVASPWAGKNWGAIFLPRVGQEVLVEFINGDPDQPVVTGSLYNGDQMPPYELPSNATVSGIRTRSSKGGLYANANEIRFEDKKGAEALGITAEKDLNLLAKNNLTIQADHDLTITSPRGLGINTISAPGVSLNVGGLLAASTFQGSGAGLTSLTASALSGTVGDANLPPNLARLNLSQTFSDHNAFLGHLSAGGPIGEDTLTIYGNARLNNNDLFLREDSDLNHGLGWRGDWKRFAGLNPDGPVLFGCAGGALGTVCNGEKMAVKWDWLGRVGVDPHGLNTGNLSSNALTFGVNQTEGIASARSGSGNLNGIDFYTAGTNRLSITADGQVGIGTDNPTHLLQLNSSASGNLLRLTGPGLNSSGAKINFGDREYVYLQEVTDNVLRFQAARLGIGRTPATNRFELEGDASKTLAGGWLANSDARIKKDIEPVCAARAVLEKVRPISFRYTEEYRKAHPSVADHRYLNVVAQEFREVFPDYVKASGEAMPDGSEILQVDTYPLIIYSAAAIRELNEELKAKDRELGDLQKRVAALEDILLNLSKKTR